LERTKVLWGGPYNHREAPKCERTLPHVITKERGAQKRRSKVNVGAPGGGDSKWPWEMGKPKDGTLWGGPASVSPSVKKKVVGRLIAAHREKDGSRD